MKQNLNLFEDQPFGFWDFRIKTILKFSSFKSRGF
jgi:hypothetical protein